MRIAITGGSGSLGRALIKRLTRDGADRIVTFSRDEQKRAALWADFGWHPGFRVMAGDVRDAPRLVDLFAGCEVVVHAAARKVVTSHPDEPEEMLKTNVLGTQNVIEAARHADVRKLLFISSDKAVAPVNCYGISKALAEHLCVQANARTLAHGLRIGVVRYGNVIGSTGSVLALWRQQRAAGQLLTITDGAMTRFWITLGQAVDLILWALANLRGGEIVVPRLPAASMRTTLEAFAGDAAQHAVETGVRPGGEKRYEQLLTEQEVLRACCRQGLYVVAPYQHAEMWDTRPWLGDPVPPDLMYRSDTWPWRLTVAELRELLERA